MENVRETVLDDAKHAVCGDRDHVLLILSKSSKKHTDKNGYHISFREKFKPYNEGVTVTLRHILWSQLDWTNSAVT